MDSQQSVLKELTAYVDAYRAGGAKEYAQRLQEQTTLIDKKFTEVRDKFQRFRHPRNIEPRLTRALRELRGIEEATCLLELATENPEAIEEQLNHCLVFELIIIFVKVINNKN